MAGLVLFIPRMVLLLFDASASNGYNFGYVINGQIKGLYRCKGTLPLYYQVGEYNGFVM